MRTRQRKDDKGDGGGYFVVGADVKTDHRPSDAIVNLAWTQGSCTSRSGVRCVVVVVVVIVVVVSLWFWCVLLCFVEHLIVSVLAKCCVGLMFLSRRCSRGEEN